MKNIKGLDTLRAFAVLLVILQHWGPFEITAVPIYGFFYRKILPSGVFAVNFFFVLSGFLISGILINSKEATAGESKFMLIRNFMARRVLRILPIYFILLLFLYLCNFDDVRRNIAYYATDTSNFLFFHQSLFSGLGHTWSLAVEEQFYLIWPLVIIFTPPEYLLKIIVAFILFGTAIDVITEHIYGNLALILPFNCFNAFAIGALYAYARTNENDQGVITRALFYLLPLGLFMYITNLCGVRVFPQRLADSIIAVNLVIYVTEARYGKIAGFFIDNKMLNNLGKISYGVYLYHFIIPYYYTVLLSAIKKNNYLPAKLYTIIRQPSIRELIQFGFVILLSYLSFKLIEVRILKLKKYFEYTKRNVAEPAKVASAV